MRRRQFQFFFHVVQKREADFTGEGFSCICNSRGALALTQIVKSCYICSQHKQQEKKTTAAVPERTGEEERLYHKIGESISNARVPNHERTTADVNLRACRVPPINNTPSLDYRRERNRFPKKSSVKRATVDRKEPKLKRARG